VGGEGEGEEEGEKQTPHSAGRPTQDWISRTLRSQPEPEPRVRSLTD